MPTFLVFIYVFFNARHSTPPPCFVGAITTIVAVSVVVLLLPTLAQAIYKLSRAPALIL
jgi:hypothetical protein